VSKVILDASALLAVLRHERGHEKLTGDVLADAAISTVNLSEVQAKLVKEGMDPDDVWSAAISLVKEVLPFTAEQARITGDLVTKTKSLGLSLGDRTCLSLGLLEGVPIYTADRSWNKLRLGISIHSIR